MPSTLTERIASREAWIGSAAAACTSVSAPATSRSASPRTADVARQLLDLALERPIGERCEIERPHVLPVGDEPAREVQAEKAGTARDRPERHGQTLPMCVAG